MPKKNLKNIVDTRRALRDIRHDREKIDRIAEQLVNFDDNELVHQWEVQFQLLVNSEVKLKAHLKQMGGR